MTVKKYALATVLLVLLIGAMVLIKLTRETPTTPFRPAPPLRQQPKSYNEFLALSGKAVELSDPTICTQVKGYTYDGGDYTDRKTTKEAENDCYYSYATKKLDIKVCDKISTTGVPGIEKFGTDVQHATCLYRVQKALGKFSEEYCDRIKTLNTTWYLDECVRELVGQTGNESLCYKYFEIYPDHWCLSILK